ncbi:hypothetical protein J6590_094312 [Homalodisca vitripennis]|nr:hypothetical protein J6590_094312 [Homalodisca vitripennis]
MSAPGGGKRDADILRSSGLRRTPPGSALTTPAPATVWLRCRPSVSVGRRRMLLEPWRSAVGGVDRLEVMVREALGVLELNTAKMSKANVSTLRDTILELEREIAKQREDVAHYRGRVDERSSIQRFLSERDGGWGIQRGAPLLTDGYLQVPVSFSQCVNVINGFVRSAAHWYSQVPSKEQVIWFPGNICCG